MFSKTLSVCAGALMAASSQDYSKIHCTATGTLAERGMGALEGEDRVQLRFRGSGLKDTIIPG